MRWTSLVVAALALLACDRPVEPPASKPAKAAPSGPTATAPSAVAPVPRLPAPARIVALGDLHGDLEATRAALRLGGVLDAQDRWSGGATTVVQTGDQLDRGDDERKILDLLDRLGDEAKAAGGSVIVLNGNHETMNVALDFRYVTEAGFQDFGGAPGPLAADPRIARLPEKQRGRAAAFLPGGPVAKRLARRPVIAVVGDNVFVHGGLAPKHLRYGVERINREVAAWMEGQTQDPPSPVTAEDGPLWMRRYSAAPAADDCRVLKETLDAVPAKRMVMGHTPQRGGISSACDGRAWRIDVGLSKHYGGTPEVLEIKGDEVKALK